jgi:hypothetical protein
VVSTLSTHMTWSPWCMHIKSFFCGENAIVIICIWHSLFWFVKFFYMYNIFPRVW